MSSNIIFSNTNSSFKEVSKLMKKNNIGFIPIKCENDYIGVITDRDICLAIGEINNINDSIKSYITRDIVFIDINESIENALKTMSKYKIKRLLVKDNDNVIGVLSLSDIINNFNDIEIINTCKEIFYLNNSNK